jgi:hypothetical protein
MQVNEIEIDKNYTRYASEDIKKLLSTVNWWPTSDGRRVFTIHGASEWEFRRHRSTIKVNRSAKGCWTLRILNPGAIVETLDPMSQLAYGMDPTVLPSEAVARLLSHLHWAKGFRGYPPSHGNAEGLSIRVNARRQDRRVKLTQEERTRRHVERYKADNRGERSPGLITGGKTKFILGSTSRSGGRSARYQWHERIEEAGYYYNRELEYRQAIAHRHELQPDCEYEKFSEYLFHMAEKFAERGQ